MTGSQETSPGLGKRIVITTTVDPETHAFFRDHKEFVVGRSLDIWVHEQRGKEIEAKVEQFTKLSEALEVGGCSCGRMLRPRETKAGPAGRCFGCGEPPTGCGCRMTRELALRHVLDWQRIRADAGIPTTHQDLEAKRMELGLTLDPDREAELRRKEREVSRKRSEESLKAGSEWHQGPAIVRPTEPK
ncbi:MAG: hypothetical protein L3K18_09620 [Thermoplasmata archaeon]|nr:hypothetical protein [Thermoplasmata archaeon]